MTDQLIESAINNKARNDLHKDITALEGYFNEMIPKRNLTSERWADAFEKHAAINGSSIMSDCVSLFPEMFNSVYDRTRIIIQFANIILLMADVDHRDTKETLVRRYKERVTDRMMKNLPKDEAPDETIVITGKDISVQ